jgi:hypothetical protein
MRSLAQLRFLGVALSLVLTNLFSLAQGTTAASPQVQVTFYSSGRFLKSAIPGNKHAMFLGRIMDGNKQLAMLTPGHFVTFNLDPGQHILTANSWMIASPFGGGHLKINLVPGQHYYVGTYLESLVVASKFRVEQRTCQEAQEDNKTTKPLSREHIKEYGLASAVAATSFPTCSQTALGLEEPRDK